MPRRDVRVQLLREREVARLAAREGEDMGARETTYLDEGVAVGRAVAGDEDRLAVRPIDAVAVSAKRS